MSPGFTYEAAFQALMAEYSALRAEILAFQNLHGQVINIAVLFLGATLGFLAAYNSSNPVMALRPYHALFVALLYSVLGLIYADAEARLLQAASYLEKELRPRLLPYAGDEVLKWEEFRRSSVLPLRRTTKWLNWLRYAFFLLPGGLALGYYAMTSAGMTPPEMILFLVDLGLFVFLIATSVKTQRFAATLT
jgi:hypothetical protein